MGIICSSSTKPGHDHGGDGLLAEDPALRDRCCEELHIPLLLLQHTEHGDRLRRLLRLLLIRHDSVEVRRCLHHSESRERCGRGLVVGHLLHHQVIVLRALLQLAQRESRLNVFHALGLPVVDDAHNLLSAPRREALPPWCATRGHWFGGCERRTNWKRRCADGREWCSKGCEGGAASVVHDCANSGRRPGQVLV